MTSLLSASTAPPKPAPASNRIDIASVRIDAAPAASDAAAAGAWDAFVCTHPEAGLGHLAGTRRMSATLPRVTDRSLVAVDAAERVVGVFPLFESWAPAFRVLRRTGLVSGAMLPGGPLVDPRACAKDREALLERFHDAAESLARSIGADELVTSMPGVVRDRPATETYPVSPFLRHGYRDAPRAGLWLDVTDDEDSLLKRLEQNCRNRVRKCRRDGFSARVLTDRDAWMRCHELSLGYEEPNRFPRAFFETLWDEFVARDRALPVVVGRGEDEVASLVLMSLFQRTSYYWFGFTRKPQAAPGVSNLALWEGILAARERGASIVELGSLEFSKARESSISRFKQAFGGRPYVGWAGTKDLRPARRAALELGDAAVAAVRSFRRRRAETAEPAAAAAAPEAARD